MTYIFLGFKNDNRSAFAMILNVFWGFFSSKTLIWGLHGAF